MGLCGPSAQEQELAQSQQFLDTMLNSDFAQRFGQQSATFNALNNSLSPVVALGPEQQGFSPEELATRNTEAINRSAAANRNAVQAAGNVFAGQNNTSGLESGIQQNVRGQIAATEAGNLANEQNRITEENYAVGRENYGRALSGLETLAGMQNPTPYAGEATEANKVGFSEAKDINQQKQQVGQVLGGLAGSALQAGLGFATGGISNVLAGGAEAGSETGGGLEQFISGGFSRLAGN